MIIAVNTRLNKKTQPEGYEDFIFTILDQLVKKNPQHQFVFIFDSAYDEKKSFSSNVLPVITGPKTSSFLRLQYWLNYKVPFILRKYKADVFLSMEGNCSLRTKTPQCLLISDLSYLQFPLLSKKPQTRFYKKFTPAFLLKAKCIATVSANSKKIIAQHYHIPASEITVVHPVIHGSFMPLDWEEQEIIKEKYAAGRSYFLYCGNSNLINLLKAFSFFKKRQKSNMLLLISCKADEPFKKELKTYKFRDEVVMLENLSVPDLAKITASAYAMVHPVLYEEMALFPLQAMHCQVPVVTSGLGSLPAVFGEAALYANPDNYEDIARQMMLVFKDEDRVKELVKAGNELMQQYQADKNAGLLMQCILK
jgi:glycosyltransferase involved in cell wall biosynthesis